MEAGGDDLKKLALLILAVVCVLVPIIAWARTLTEEMTAGLRLLAAGRVLGLVGFVLVLIQFVLSSRVKWIERGIGLDRLLAAHAICGKVGLALVLIYPAFLFASDVVQGNHLVFSSPKLVGAASLLALLLAGAWPSPTDRCTSGTGPGRRSTGQATWVFPWRWPTACVWAPTCGLCHCGSSGWLWAASTELWSCTGPGTGRG